MPRNTCLPLCLLAAFLYLFLFRGRLNWMGDDGFFISCSERLLEGQVPYRDFNAHFTPGSLYLLAGCLKLLGNFWGVTRIAWLILVLVQATGVYLLLRRTTGSLAMSTLGFSLVVIPAGVNPIYNHHHLSAALALGSTFAWLEWFREGKLRYAAAAGLADGVVFWVSQDKGALLAVAAIGITLALGPFPRKIRLRGLGGYAAAAAGVSLPFIVLLAAQGAWRDFIQDCLLFLFKGYGSVSGVPYGRTYADSDGAAAVVVAARNLSLLWYALAPLIALPAEAFLCWRRPADRRITALFLFQGASLWAAALHHPDIDHLVWVTHLPTALLGTQLYALATAWKNGPRGGLQRAVRLGAGISLGLVFAVGIASALTRTLNALRRPRYEIRTERDVAWTWSQDLAATANGIVEEVARTSGPKSLVLAYPHSSLYRRLVDGINPTRYEVLIEGYLDGAQLQEVIDALDAKAVPLIILDGLWNEARRRAVLPYSEVDFRQGRLMNYLRAHYVPQRVLPHATLYRRKG